MTDTIRFNFQGTSIRDDGQFMCLTDMWRAAGANENRKPAIWLRQEATQQFAEYLAESKVTDDHFGLIRTERGGSNPGTWAHWQLAMAYAKYLSPAFHAWCNEVVRAVMQQGGSVDPELRGALQSFAQTLQVVAETVQTLSRAQAATDQRLTDLERRSGGALGNRIHPFELRSLRARVFELAGKAVQSGTYKSVKSARASFYSMIRSGCGWTGAGARLDNMPAAAFPDAERVLAGLERVYRSTIVDRQQPLFRCLPGGRTAQ